jgi:hypothetical protein
MGFKLEVSRLGQTGQDTAATARDLGVFEDLAGRLA